MSTINLFTESWQSLWGSAIPENGVGSVYTRPEIVSLILDLAGYSAASGGDLSRLRVLEPSCGSGAFVMQIVERMIASREGASGQAEWDSPHLAEALRAVDINPTAVRNLREEVQSTLMQSGCPEPRAWELAETWIFQTDFLLHEWGRSKFDIVVGNPPYVRIEDLPRPVLREYRNRSTTARDRSDIYISFIETGLGLLSPGGRLGYICANRFAKNQYGRGLRNLISDRYHVRWYLNLEHTQPFEEEVSAYPAVIVLDRQREEETLAATIDDISESTLSKILSADRGESVDIVSKFDRWYQNGAPWVATTSSEALELGSIEERFPLLEDSAEGTRVGIGVATGADQVFILPAKSDEIEERHQLPLVLARHISIETIDWGGEYVINPFDPEQPTGLVDLAESPGLARYLNTHQEAIRRRYVARQRPERWYRTIDRIHPTLTSVEKLVIPDIQPGGIIGYDGGRFYPHHNVYYVISSGWDLRALQALLRSSFVSRQIAAHSVQMRGGSLRYQAGTLRKIRIPHRDRIDSGQVEMLRNHATDSDVSIIDSIVEEILRLA